MANGSLINFLVANSAVVAPKTNDGVALGNGSLGFADLFLAAGDAEARTAINTLLARLRAHGLIAT